MEPVYIGPRRRGGYAPRLYAEDVWHERDDFARYPTAVAYAQHLSRNYPPTPYRIVVGQDGRYHVDYVPAWHLRDAQGRPTEDVPAIKYGDVHGPTMTDEQMDAHMGHARLFTDEPCPECLVCTEPEASPVHRDIDPTAVRGPWEVPHHEYRA